MIARILLLTAFITTESVVAQPKVILPEHFVKIPEDGDRTFDKKKAKQDEEIRLLKARTKVLEEAVRQLQEEVYWLRYANDIKPSPKERNPSVWFCSVKSAFDRTYTGQGETQVEARAKAMDSCEKADGGLHCKDEKMVCEKEG